MTTTTQPIRTDGQLTLAFGTVGGPLVAFASLTGGAGASTAAHLLAAAAARESSAPILLADTGGLRASIASYATCGASGSLHDLVRDVEQGRRPPSPFVLADDGLRVLACEPRIADGETSAQATGEVLQQATAAHGLTVLDCVNPAARLDQLVLAAATHVIWVTQAGAWAVARASDTLAALDPAAHGREIVLARQDRDGRPASMSALTEICEQRDADLALLPHIADAHSASLEARLEQAAVTLHALAGAIVR